MTSIRLRLAVALFLAASQTLQSTGQETRTVSQRSSYLQSLATLYAIDAHAHVWKDDPVFNAMLERLNLHIVDILYVDDKDPTALSLDQQRAVALAFTQSAHRHASLCTTFDPFRFSQSEFVQTTIEGLNRDFANGAIAVKIWKNIGMELKDSSGRYVLADNPRFEPIYRDIAAHNKTLIAQAEPDVAWGPLDPKALDDSYYANTRNGIWRRSQGSWAESSASRSEKDLSL